MTSTVLLLIPLWILLILLVLGVPIAYTMLISGTLGVVLVVGSGPAEGLLAGAPRNPISFSFTTIPLFVLMAEFLSKSGLVKDVFKATQNWLGHIPGGLAIATAVANGGMAALSGSSTATVAAMSKLSYGEMKKYGYRDDLSLGTLSSAGTFAIMIPPSLGLIIYGLLTQNNIAVLFLAGIIPGILTLIGYTFVIIGWSYYDPDVAPKTEKASHEERMASTRRVWPGLIVVILVLGGIYGGVMTASEAGAIGAASALLVTVLVYDMGVNDIYEAMVSTLEISGMVFMIFVGALIFGLYLTVTQLPQKLILYIETLPLTALQILLIIIFLYILMGAFLDQLAILLITLPITYPLVVNGLGFGPIWFGIIIVKTIEIGLITPPIGMNVYIAAGAVDADIVDGFKGSARFIGIDLLIIALLIVYPGIVTWVV
jgi:tripartite ATP-independent transporter DctM subunit